MIKLLGIFFIIVNFFFIFPVKSNESQLFNTDEINNLINKSKNSENYKKEKERWKNLQEWRKNKKLSNSEDLDISDSSVPIEITIPVQIFIIQVNKLNFKTNKLNNPKSDFNKMNKKYWNPKGIHFEIINISSVEGDDSTIIEDINWVDTEFCKLYKKNRSIFSTSSGEKFNRVGAKLIKYKVNRNPKAINIFYVPRIGCTFCGGELSFSRREGFDKEKKKNIGYIEIATNQSGCTSTAKRISTIAHELGHYFSLDHVRHYTEANISPMDANKIGTSFTKNEINVIKSYYNKFLSKTLN